MNMHEDIKQMIQKVHNLGTLHLLQQFPKVVSVDFDSEFNDDISGLTKYLNLIEIRFGSSFNCPIDVFEEEELSGLKVIVFGSSFNQSIEPIKKLKNLVHIDLRCSNFRQSFEPIFGCASLHTYLIRGGKGIRILKQTDGTKKIETIRSSEKEQFISTYGFGSTTTIEIDRTIMNPNECSK